MDACDDLGELLQNYWPVLVGNALEWYEFAVYGYLETYMEKNFFRGSTVATWLGFTATFCARPLGGMVLGLLSDLLGRQRAVVLTGLGMLVATVGQGLLPTPRAWGEQSLNGHLGLWLLLALRLLQGVCAGGEIGAVSTYVAEVAAPRSMGRCSSLIGVSGNMGFLGARAAIWMCQAFWTEEEMADIGWRVPFLLALIPGVISVGGRICCLKESEVFEAESEALLKDDGEASQRLGRFAASQWRSVVVAMGTVVSPAIFNYGGCVWSNSFLKKHGAQRDFLMPAGICSRFLQMALAYPMGWLTDIYGCAFVVFAGAVVQICCGFPFFMALEADPGSISNLFVTYGICYAWVASFNATICMYCAELFPTHVRNLGVGLSFNLGVGLFGGFAPLAAEALSASRSGPGLLFSGSGVVTAAVMLLGVEWQRKGPAAKMGRAAGRQGCGGLGVSRRPAMLLARRVHVNRSLNTRHRVRLPPFGAHPATALLRKLGRW